MSLQMRTSQTQEYQATKEILYLFVENGDYKRFFSPFATQKSVGVRVEVHSFWTAGISVPYEIRNNELRNVRLIVDAYGIDI